MSTFLDCRETAQHLVGRVITHVRYLGLFYDGASVPWDFGDWHWPEVGVELEVADGELFHAIWDARVINFDLTFARGPISNDWAELREEPKHTRFWDVTDHAGWRDLVGHRITDCAVITSAADDPSDIAPLAVRITAADECAWIVLAQPEMRHRVLPPHDLRANDVLLRSDEVIVLFSDERAEALGITASDA